MLEESGNTLSMSAEAVFKSSAKENAIQEKIHELAYTVGFSKLVPFDANTRPKFGEGVWYNSSEKNNTVYSVMPATPVFAGILVRQNYIKNAQPAKPDTIEAHNKALLMQYGYLKYKTGFALDGTTVQTYADVTAGMSMYISNLTGRPHFAVTGTVANHTAVGKIKRMNPDDKSWTVRIDY